MRYDPIETGKRIRSYREDIGMSRSDFADSIGISLSHLQKIEIGANGPSIDLLVDISEKYGISLDYLIKGANSYSNLHTKIALEEVVAKVTIIIRDL